MSATEVIEDLEKLPRIEQDKVFDYLARQRANLNVTESRPITYASDTEAEAAGDVVFREHAELLRRLAK